MLHARDSHFKPSDGCHSKILSKVRTSHNSAMFFLLFSIIFEECWSLDDLKKALRMLSRSKFLEQKEQKNKYLTLVDKTLFKLDFQSSHMEMFYCIDVLKNFAKFTRKLLRHILLFLKVAG